MKLLSSLVFRRFGALFYDCFVLFSLWILATALALLLNQGESFLPHQWLFLGYLFSVTGLFFCYCWHKKGQTLGMLAWGIVVLDAHCHPLSWKKAAIRYVFGTLSFLTGGLGLLWCLFDKQKQTFYDKLAGSQIVLVSSLQKKHPQCKK